MKKGKLRITRNSVYVMLFLFFSMLMIVGYFVYSRVFVPNVKPSNAELYIYIPTGAGFSDVLSSLSKQDLLIDIESFEIWIGKIIGAIAICTCTSPGVCSARKVSKCAVGINTSISWLTITCT